MATLDAVRTRCFFCECPDTYTEDTAPVGWYEPCDECAKDRRTPENVAGHLGGVADGDA